MPRRNGVEVTLRDVAARVGVTAAAASMALAGNPRISAQTTRKIQDAAAELGYVPSSAGRALRSKKSGSIALIVPNSAQHVFGHSYFMHVLNGVTAVANERDTQLLISTSTTEANGIAAYERVLRSRSADGAIVTSSAVNDPNIERLTEAGLPVVLIGNFPDLPQAVSVGQDDRAASSTITEHLIVEHGCRRLMHVAGALDHQTGIDRRDGFLDAVRAHGLEGEPLVVEGDFSERAGAEAIASLDGNGPLPDGIVVANDDMAFGAMTSLRARGKRVPDDVAVVGFDDFGVARLTTPGITTMHVPAEQMGVRAAELLLDLISQTSVSTRRVDVEPVLVARDSCGCPPRIEHVLES